MARHVPRVGFGARGARKRCFALQRTRALRQTDAPQSSGSMRRAIEGRACATTGRRRRRDRREKEVIAK